MTDVLIIVLLAALSLFLLVRVRKLKNTPESKLSIYEHPATFAKPPIETVGVAAPTEQSDPDSAVFNVESSEDEMANP